MAGYKDDLDAAHQRIAALEQEVHTLRAGPPAAPTAASPRTSGTLSIAAGAVLTCVAGLAGLCAVGLMLRVPLLFIDAMLLAALCGIVAAAIGARQLTVLRPWQAAVFSGLRHHVVVGPASLLRLPLLERVELLDLRLRCLEWSLASAPARDGARATLRGYLALAPEPTLHAIELASKHFLGAGVDAIAEGARPLVEQAVRSAVAALEARELERGSAQLQHQVAGAIADGLERLGLRALAFGVTELAVEGAPR
jgi:uncharacterized membrane protein YqiK